MTNSELGRRKLEHIQIVRERPVEPYTSPYMGYQLPYNALPEVNLQEIDTKVPFLNTTLQMPFVVSSMTGGPTRSETINKHLALAAQACGVALALGSMRIILDEPEALHSFAVRDLCPDVPLLANVGLVQLNYGYGADELNQIVDSIQADGIFLHLNPLQEAIQPGGDTNFKGLWDKLNTVLPKVKVPVLVKEVGSGISGEVAQRLVDAGVQWIDVAGTGGTSWSWVEGYRRDDDLGELFKGVGLPTDECLRQAREVEGARLIAGGVRSGLDMAKALMLGADLTTCAKPMLDPALTSSEACVTRLKQFAHELRVAMFSVGAENVNQLKAKQLTKMDRP